MTTYDLPPATGKFEVGASFATQGRDPDDDAELGIFLASSPYVHPRDETLEYEYLFSVSDQGRDVLQFSVWIPRHGQSPASLDPLLLPANATSIEYERAVGQYVDRACTRLQQMSEAIVKQLTHG
jgi:hypothetical protein